MLLLLLALSHVTMRLGYSTWRAQMCAVPFQDVISYILLTREIFLELRSSYSIDFLLHVLKGLSRSAHLVCLTIFSIWFFFSNLFTFFVCLKLFCFPVLLFPSQYLFIPLIFCLMQASILTSMFHPLPILFRVLLLILTSPCMLVTHVPGQVGHSKAGA